MSFLSQHEWGFFSPNWYHAFDGIGGRACNAEISPSTVMGELSGRNYFGANHLWYACAKCLRVVISELIRDRLSARGAITLLLAID